MAQTKQAKVIEPTAQPEPLPNPSQVRDSDGLLWDICETLYTGRGFPLFLGHRAGTPKKHIGMIVTQPLLEYWEAHIADFDSVSNLPASRASIAKIRQVLDGNIAKARRHFWSHSIAALKRLSVCQFAEEFGVPIRTAIRWRATRLGYLRKAWPRLGPDTGRLARVHLGIRAIRPLPPKWNTPEVISVLASALTLAQAAQALQISATHVQRLRVSYRHQQQLAAANSEHTPPGGAPHPHSEPPRTK